MQRRKFLQATAVIGSVPATVLGAGVAEASRTEGAEKPTYPEVFNDEAAHAYFESTDDPFPGCEILIYANNWPLAGVVKVDTRNRTVNHVEWRKDGELVSGDVGGSCFVDGVPLQEWREWFKVNRQTTVAYDAIVLRGELDLLMKYRDEGKVPRDWLLMSTLFPKPGHAIGLVKRRTTEVDGVVVDVHELESSWLHSDDSWRLHIDGDDVYYDGDTRGIQGTVEESLAMVHGMRVPAPRWIAAQIKDPSGEFRTIWARGHSPRFRLERSAPCAWSGR
jgi:hypothetical protein